MVKVRAGSPDLFSNTVITMRTLLDQVVNLENESLRLIDEAEEKGKKILSDLMTDEKRVITDIRKKAEKRAEAIVLERVQSAKSELNKLHQEEAGSIEQIKTVAKQNRADTVEMAVGLFQKEYLPNK